MTSPRSLPSVELPPSFPDEWSEFLRSLLTRLDQLVAENAELKERVQRQAATIGVLRDEIAVLKGQKGRPQIKPSRMDKESDKDDEPPDGKAGGKRPRTGKPAKTAKLEIHEERTIKAVGVPEGSRFLGHREFTVQDLRISAHNTRFLLERWAIPGGQVLTAKCPRELAGRNRSLSGVLFPSAPIRNNSSHVHEGGIGSDQGNSKQQQEAAAEPPGVGNRLCTVCRERAGDRGVLRP